MVVAIDPLETFNVSPVTRRTHQSSQTANGAGEAGQVGFLTVDEPGQRIALGLRAGCDVWLMVHCGSKRLAHKIGLDRYLLF